MNDHESFERAVKRGREFEAEERAGWSHIPADSLTFEAPSQWNGRRGRIDIVVDDSSGLVAIVETKATEWDRSQIRVNAMRTVMRSAAPITKPASPAFLVPCEPLVADTATDAVPGAQLRHRESVAQRIANKSNSFFHRYRLHPGHRPSSRNKA